MDKGNNLMHEVFAPRGRAGYIDLDGSQMFGVDRRLKQTFRVFSLKQLLLHSLTRFQNSGVRGQDLGRVWMERDQEKKWGRCVDWEASCNFI